MWASVQLVDNIAVKLCSSTTISKMARNNILQELHILNIVRLLFNNGPLHYKAMHSEQTCQQLLIPLVQDMFNLPTLGLTTTSSCIVIQSIFTTSKRDISF